MVNYASLSLTTLFYLIFRGGIMERAVITVLDLGVDMEEMAGPLVCCAGAVTPLA